MKEQIYQVLNDINSFKVLEAHSNHEISDEEFTNLIEGGYIDPELAEMYIDVIEKMESKTLTEEDQAYLFNAYTEGYIYEGGYESLIESGIVDIEFTKDMLMESVGLAEINAVFKPGKDPKAPKGATYISSTSASIINRNKVANSNNNKVKGTWDSVKKAGNNLVGHGANAVGAVARAVGAHNVANKVYGFAANRFAAAGNVNQTHKANTNSLAAVKAAANKAKVQTNALNKVSANAAAKNGSAVQPAAKVKESFMQMDVSNIV